jgi:hypothetical protein
LEHGDGIKPSTLKSYRYMLGAPGGQAMDSITTTQIERWLEGLDAEDISKRTVNTYRQRRHSSVGPLGAGRHISAAGEPW